MRNNQIDSNIHNSDSNSNGATATNEKYKSRVPFALFNSKALFNPYQYKPFFKIFNFNEIESCYNWNGKNLLITDEVGVGKTFEAGIVLMERLKNEKNLSILIICPVKLCKNWQEEMSENFYINFNNYRETKSFKRFNIVPYSYFSGKQYKDTFEEEMIEKDLPNIREGDNFGKSIKIPEYDILIIDEAHYLRNKDSVLWKSINSIIEESGKNKLNIFMTATPIFNKEKDYENITELLKYDKGFETTTTLQGEANCYDFNLEIKEKIVQINNIEKKIMDDIYIEGKYGSTTGFLKRISSSSFYSLKKFLEKKSLKDVYMDSSEIDKNDLESNKIKELLELTNEWNEVNDSKFKELLSVIHTTDESRVIIFSCFIDTCTYLSRRLKNEGFYVEILTGKSKQKEVEGIKTRFKDRDSKSILICSDAAKEGHNLQFCHCLIHYDFPYTPAALGQRNGRIYRRGQEGIPKSFYMHVENSYDDRLFGEIIVEKTHIIKNASDKNLISILNVLPSDSKEYIDNCIEKYFDYQVNKRDSKENNSREKKEFLFQFKKKFSYIKNERTWISEEYKNRYEVYKKETKEKDYYKKEFVKILTGGNEDMEQLKNYYEEQYTQMMSKFIKLVYDINCTGNIEKLNEEFVSQCDNYLESRISDNYSEALFCHKGVKDEKLNILEYKKNFKPLFELERN